MSTRGKQRERRKQYFIEAAKRIIRSEGVDQISVRKVADVAGYSYATVYNYFNDFDDLLWHVVVDFTDAMIKEFDNKRPVGSNGLQQLKHMCRMYVEYFLEQPAVYRLLFLTDLGQPSQEIEAALKTPYFSRILKSVLEQCAEEGFIAAAEIPVLIDTITAVVHGMLLLYFSKKLIIDEHELMQKLEANIDYLIGSDTGSLMKGGC